MPRLFVALPLPDWAVDRLVAVQPPPLPGTRLAVRTDMHLTLHFIGEVEDRQEEAVRTALSMIRRRPFTITLKAVGRFPPDGDAKTLWAGVQPSSELTELHGAVALGLADAIGFRQEARPYTPHVTLAHLKIAPVAGEVERYLETRRSFEVAEVPVTQFALYSSKHSEESIPRYNVEAMFSLDGASADRP